jgi:hypothetical protein
MSLLDLKAHPSTCPAYGRGQKGYMPTIHYHFYYGRLLVAGEDITLPGSQKSWV